ncbi:FHA domain-containing protein [Pseudarthrobacter sp. NamE5]|uniref:FHA domain-containing protein n=1 Tax=Pseudarthrobacter sp. NamE5 TaxID=2576839 RepID=UPI00110ABE05|nr:FHA domain-containing protein [Pseudarthrobacter sp. NamE5]TLM85240.1 FHA domain-containing protein [Pseudarthrobacter sp. NamE5]
MAATSYSPGSWLGIIRSETAVLLGPGTAPATAEAVWDLLAGRPPAHEVLHAVTSGSGGSLTQIPSFGILDFSGPLRVFLRGDLDLAVELPNDRVELDGRDVTTWNERRFALPDACRLTIPAAGTAGAVELPLGEGVVLLQALALSLDPRRSGLTAAPSPSAAAVAVDSAGVADLDAAPGTDHLPGVTLAPEQEASAETIVGVPDDDAHLDETGQEPGSGGALPEASADDHTSSYDHLWERTVIRNIEDAAVRDETEPGGPALGGTAAAAREGERPPAPEPAASHAPLTEPAPARAGTLIDSVPWKTGTGAVPTPAVPTPAAAAQDAPAAQAPALASPEPGPAPAAAEAPAPGLDAAGQQPPSAGAEFDGDHDGQTVMRSSIRVPAAQAAPVAGGDPSTGPRVLARVCSQGHPNPPTRAHCSTCGSGLPPDAVQVPRPRLGRMRMSTGELFDLDQSLVIGRQPSVSRVQGGTMPRLVQVPSPEGDISRSHVEVRLEGWHVMLCDLKATNGTVLVREGQPPRRLAQNEMAILLDGDIAELGDDLSLRFEEIP